MNSRLPQLRPDIGSQQSGAFAAPQMFSGNR